MKYKCPHCGKAIGEVRVIELVWKRVLVSCGLGAGCGLIFYALVPGSLMVGSIGAFIIAFTIVFLLTMPKRLKKK